MSGPGPRLPMAVSTPWGAPEESAPGQAQHPLGDDVALDLARPSRDGARERPEVLGHPRPLPPATRPGERGVDGLGAEGLDPREAQSPLDLAAVELQHQVLGRRLPARELPE